MKVSLLYAPAARHVEEAVVTLEEGATVADALQACGWLSRFAELQGSSDIGISVWGRKATDDHILREGDRVEFCRALRVDPKVARRERFSRQGAKTAGLFSRRRQGAKPGY